MRFNSKSIMGLSFRIVIPIVFLIWVAWYLLTNPLILSPLLNIPIELVFGLIVTQAISIFVTSFYTKLMTRPFDVNVKTSEAFLLNYVARASNMVLPMKAGAGIRAYYLLQKHDLALADFSAIFGGQTLLTAFLACTAGLIGILVIYSSSGLMDEFGITFLLVASITLLGLLLVSPSLPRHKWRVLNFLSRSLQSWNIIKNDHVLILRISILSIINTILASFTIWLSFLAIESKPDAGSSLYLGAVQDIGYLASITPGSIGIVEGATIFLGSQLEIGLPEILSVALIARTAVFAVAVLPAPFCAWALFGQNWKEELHRARSYVADE